MSTRTTSTQRPNSAYPNPIAGQTTGISTAAPDRARTGARRPRIQPSGGRAIRGNASITLRGRLRHCGALATHQDQQPARAHPARGETSYASCRGVSGWPLGADVGCGQAASHRRHKVGNQEVRRHRAAAEVVKDQRGDGVIPPSGGRNRRKIEGCAETKCERLLTLPPDLGQPAEEEHRGSICREVLVSGTQGSSRA